MMSDIEVLTAILQPYGIVYHHTNEWKYGDIRLCVDNGGRDKGMPHYVFSLDSGYRPIGIQWWKEDDHLVWRALIDMSMIILGKIYYCSSWDDPAIKHGTIPKELAYGSD